MTETNEHQAVDFFNMPLSNEQKILAALERIESLLKAYLPELHLNALTTKAPVQAPAPKKPFGRK